MSEHDVGACTCMSIDLNPNGDAEMCWRCYEEMCSVAGLRPNVVDLGPDPWGGSVRMKTAAFNELSDAYDDAQETT